MKNAIVLAAREFFPTVREVLSHPDPVEVHHCMIGARYDANLTAITLNDAFHTWGFRLT